VSSKTRDFEYIARTPTAELKTDRPKAANGAKSALAKGKVATGGVGAIATTTTTTTTKKANSPRGAYVKKEVKKKESKKDRQRFVEGYHSDSSNAEADAEAQWAAQDGRGRACGSGTEAEWKPSEASGERRSGRKRKLTASYKEMMGEGEGEEAYGQVRGGPGLGDGGPQPYRVQELLMPSSRAGSPPIQVNLTLTLTLTLIGELRLTLIGYFRN